MSSPAGWHPDPTDAALERYWDGGSWTDQHRPRVLTLSAEQRRQQLSQAVGAWVAHGARVESQTDYQAVLVKGKPVNHVLHLILSLVTCGAWLIVWGALAAFAGEKRSVIAVDDFGAIITR